MSDQERASGDLSEGAAASHPGPFRPDQGVRVHMKRRSRDGDAATYDVELAFPDERTVTFALALVRGERPVVDEPSLEDAVRSIVEAIARTVCKGAEWPRRVTRWKPLELR